MRKLLAYFTALLLGGAVASAQNESALIDAVQLFADGRYAEAKTQFEMLHAKDSTDDAVLYYLGMCEFASGDRASCETHLKQACQVDSTNGWYLSSLASLYNSMGRQRESAKLCEKLVKMGSPTYRTPYTYTLIADGKLAERSDSLALHYYEQALELDPDYAPAEIGKAEIMRMKGNLPAFFLSLEKFVSSDIVYPDMKSNYLRALIENMDAKFYWVWGEQLGRLVDECASMHPEDVQSQVNRLNMCYIKRDTVQIVKICQDIIPLATAAKDTTNLMMAYEAIADIHHARGEEKETFAVYERALAAYPDCCPVLNNYAYYLSLKKSKLKKALKMSARTIELEPDNATYLDTYAWILYLLGRPGEAKPYFKHAMIYGGKESAVVLEHYALVLEALGETDVAAYYRSLSEQKK